MKIAKVLIGACAGAMLLTGCMTEEPIQQRAVDDRIQLIGNNSFSIELLKATTLINDDGLLTVDASALISRTAPLRRVFCGDPKLTVWYHFDWIDADGNMCKPVQHEMYALPGNIVSVHGVAPDEKYINYQLTISLKGPGVKQETAGPQEAVKKPAPKKKVKPAGKSRARQIKKSKAKPAEKKTAPAPKETVKPVAEKAAPKEAVKPVAEKAAPKEAAKPAEEKAAPKEAVKPAAEKAAPKEAAKQQKLTEPFN